MTVGTIIEPAISALRPAGWPRYRIHAIIGGGHVEPHDRGGRGSGRVVEVATGQRKDARGDAAQDQHAREHREQHLAHVSPERAASAPLDSARVRRWRSDNFCAHRAIGVESAHRFLPLRDASEMLHTRAGYSVSCGTH